MYAAYACIRIKCNYPLTLILSHTHVIAYTHTHTVTHITNLHASNRNPYGKERSHFNTKNNMCYWAVVFNLKSFKQKI